MLRIYGYSDDLIEIEGNINEEIGAYEKWATITVGDKLAGGLVIHGSYDVLKRAEEGVWTFAVEPIGEDCPIPWPVTVTLAQNGYSAQINIDCPKGTPIKWDR